MQIQSRAGQIFIAWNGVQLHIPANWDVRIGGHRTLIFEEDFRPQMQLRWERRHPSTSSPAEDSLAGFIDQLGTVMGEPPAPWRRLQQAYSHLSCYRHEDGSIGGGACICTQCSAVLSFQLLNTDPEIIGFAAECLASLSCHADNQENILWRVQDFSLMTPPSFGLTSYTFGAGLTRLSFRHKDLFLHTCRIAPADDRLRNQTLEEILLTLADVQELDIILSDKSVCQGQRRPSIPRQILWRMRREKPFLWAKIWHESRSNLLLAVVLLANRPIPGKTAAMICENYEIVVEKEGS